MRKPTITIPVPKARPGQRAWVMNYYLRPEREVVGDVLRAAYALRGQFTGGGWSYDVSVEGRKGQSYRIYVGDERIVEVIGPTPPREDR